MSQVTHESQVTAFDVWERLVDSMGANPNPVSTRDVYRAISDARDEFSLIHEWNFLKTWIRIVTNDPYQTGTITYTNSTRTLTLDSGTWPTWAVYGQVRIGNTVSAIERRVSDTVLILDAVQNPGADIAAGTAYKLGRDTYTLPETFAAGNRPLVEANYGRMSYCSFQQFLQQRRYLESEGIPRIWTYAGDPRVAGRMAIFIYPLPDGAGTLDLMTRRKMRKIQVWDYSTGKATVDGGDLDNVTITGGAFTSRHLGTIIRLGADSVNLPQALDGRYPYAEERTIVEVISASEVRVDQDFDEAHTGVTFRLSDPIDCEQSIMRNAFVACCRAQLAMQRNMKDSTKMQSDWMGMLELAKDADSVSFARRVLGDDGYQGLRMADMPSGPDIS